MLEVARRAAPRASYVRGDALELPFGDCSFDRVFTGHFYGHLEEPERVRFLAEARRVAPELVVADAPLRPNHAPAEWQQRGVSDGSVWPVYKRFFSPDALLAELGGGKILLDGEWFSSSYRRDGETSLPSSYNAPARQQALPSLRGGGLSARVVAGLRGQQQAKGLSLRTGARTRRGCRAAPMARACRPRASRLAGDGRGRLLLDVLLRVRYAMRPGPVAVGERRSTAHGDGAGALRGLARARAAAAPSAADRHRGRTGGSSAAGNPPPDRRDRRKLRAGQGHRHPAPASLGSFGLAERSRESSPTSGGSRARARRAGYPSRTWYAPGGEPTQIILSPSSPGRIFRFEPDSTNT